jgi:hypothetical protein
MTTKHWLASLLCCCLMATSCTTLRRVALPSEPQPSPDSIIKVGDTVVVTLRDGTSHQMKVDLVEPDAITGKSADRAQPQRYPFADMQTLKKRSVSFREAGATLAIVVVTALGVVVAALFGAF